MCQSHPTAIVAFSEGPSILSALAGPPGKCGGSALLEHIESGSCEKNGVSAPCRIDEDLLAWGIRDE